MMTETMTLPRVSKAESLVSRQGGLLKVEGAIRYSLRNIATGEIAWHLLYEDIADATRTARYWSDWRVTTIVLKEIG